MVLSETEEERGRLRRQICTFIKSLVTGAMDRTLHQTFSGWSVKTVGPTIAIDHLIMDLDDLPDVQIIGLAHLESRSSAGPNLSTV